MSSSKNTKLYTLPFVHFSPKKKLTSWLQKNPFNNPQRRSLYDPKMEVISPLQKKTAFGKPRIFNSITGLAAELPFKVPEKPTENQCLSWNLRILAIKRSLHEDLLILSDWGETKTQQKLTSKRTTAGFFRLMKTPTTRWNTKAVLGTWNREADLRRFVKDRGTDATTGLVSIIHLLCPMAIETQNRYSKLKITSPYFDHFWHLSLF